MAHIKPESLESTQAYWPYTERVFRPAYRCEDCNKAVDPDDCNDIGQCEECQKGV